MPQDSFKILILSDFSAFFGGFICKMSQIYTDLRRFHTLVCLLNKLRERGPKWHTVQGNALERMRVRLGLGSGPGLRLGLG